MTWAGSGTTRIMPFIEIKDGRNTRNITWSGTAIPALADTYCWRCAEYEAYVAGIGDLGADTLLPTRAQVEAWRDYHPGDHSDIPGSFVVEDATDIPGPAVRVKWALDPDIPSWGTDKLEILILRCAGSTTCTPTAGLAVVSAGSTSYVDTNVTAGTHYRYRILYRSKAVTSREGPRTAVKGVTPTDGGGGGLDPV